MAKGGKRVYFLDQDIKRIRIELCDDLIDSALKGSPTEFQFAELMRVRGKVEDIVNIFRKGPLISVVERKRKRLCKALYTIENVFARCDAERKLLEALARTMDNVPFDQHDDEDNIAMLKELRRIGDRLREQLEIGSIDLLAMTTNEDPRSFCFRALLYELAPLAKDWDFTISEKSPRFVDLIGAFGLYDTRKQTIAAIKNHKASVDLREPDKLISQ